MGMRSNIQKAKGLEIELALCLKLSFGNKMRANVESCIMSQTQGTTKIKGGK